MQSMGHHCRKAGFTVDCMVVEKKDSSNLIWVVKSLADTGEAFLENIGNRTLEPPRTVDGQVLLDQY